MYNDNSGAGLKEGTQEDVPQVVGRSLVKNTSNEQASRPLSDIEASFEIHLNVPHGCIKLFHCFHLHWVFVGILVVPAQPSTRTFRL